VVVSVDGCDRGVSQVRVGDRVRIRATIRCVGLDHELPHGPGERGHAGVVVDDRLNASFPSHRYLVTFDEPAPVLSISSGPMPLHARHYAAHELEPIG